MIVDAHQHFWQLSQPFDYRWLDDPSLAAINRDYLPEHLKQHLEATGVDKTVFVQTQHNTEENRWVLGLAEEHDFIAGVVGWVDLQSADCESQLLEFREHPKSVGIRHVVQDEPDDEFVVRSEVLRGLRVLERQRVPFDLLFYVKHLKHVDTLARELPDLVMVINHLSKPDIKNGGFESWIDDFRAAAQHANVYCKLSGMVTEADWQNWTPADLKPYIEAALENFGPERLMFGSDWPVCELAGSYQQVCRALDENLLSLSESEREQIFGKTATKVYGL